MSGDAVKNGVVTLGETMTLFRPTHPGNGAREDDYRMSFGGAESNVAIGVARLGGSATWIGRIGDDVAGRRIVRELRAEGVVVRAHVDVDAGTGAMMKSEAAPGYTAVQYWRSGSAGSRLAPPDVDADLLASAQLVHVTGITAAISDSARDAVGAAIDAAKEADVPVSFDVNHRPSLWRGRDPRPVYRELAASARFVFAGRDEGALLVGDGTDEEIVTRLAALGPTTVALKLGAEGTLVLHGGRVLRRDAIPIVPRDTVGAGDAFVAGLLTEWMLAEPIENCVHTAVSAGAFACLGSGDWENLPDRRQLSLLQSSGSDPVSR
ncbi:sugar kinase [Microbacterium sp. ET2]|uniref:sugar kinase n=1 Tax=Microbacterium albipurpureum TaxID=3050384 RepID=UPI00259D14C3|nr:sugar kinase [Microbacterium sp. ET2 (Ac-2212)]WJL97023.1 sugar kinase [Microbacterium sp. ET2 (Ac-2212)]